MNVKDIIMGKYLEGNNIDEDISRYFDPKIWGRKILGATSVSIDPASPSSGKFDTYTDVFSTKKIITLITLYLIRIILGRLYGKKHIFAAEVKFSDKELNQIKSMFKKVEKTN